MRTQRVLLGAIVIYKEPAIELFVDLPEDEVRKQSAILKDRLAYLLDTRFQPSEPVRIRHPGLTVEDVATELHCRCRTVLRMVKRGDLHPTADDDGELYFDAGEVSRMNYVSLSRKVARLIPRNSIDGPK